jgi:hypothetical protein
MWSWDWPTAQPVADIFSKEGCDRHSRVVVADTPAHLRRKKQPDIGIALIDILAGKT